jgi:hypothetical protein
MSRRSGEIEKQGPWQDNVHGEIAKRSKAIYGTVSGNSEIVVKGSQLDDESFNAVQGDVDAEVKVPKNRWDEIEGTWPAKNRTPRRRHTAWGVYTAR